jgi:hypothetical protein
MYRLNNLVGALQVREPEGSTIVAPVSPGYAFGNESIVSSSKTDKSREKASSGRRDTSDFSKQAKEFTFQVNEWSSQDRVYIKRASKTKSKSVQLRCPHYFSREGHPCGFYQSYPRDIM